MNVIQDPMIQANPLRSYQGEQRNFFGAIVSGLTGMAGSLAPEGGACFGDKSCQANRAQATANNATLAQAQLLQAQANAESAGNQMTIIMVVVLAVVLLAGLGAFLYLKKNP